MLRVKTNTLHGTMPLGSWALLWKSWSSLQPWPVSTSITAVHWHVDVTEPTGWQQQRSLHNDASVIPGFGDKHLIMLMQLANINVDVLSEHSGSLAWPLVIKNIQAVLSVSCLDACSTFCFIFQNWWWPKNISLYAEGSYSKTFPLLRVKLRKMYLEARRCTMDKPTAPRHNDRNLACYTCPRLSIICCCTISGSEDQYHSDVARSYQPRSSIRFCFAVAPCPSWASVSCASGPFTRTPFSTKTSTVAYSSIWPLHTPWSVFICRQTGESKLHKYKYTPNQKIKKLYCNPLLFQWRTIFGKRVSVAREGIQTILNKQLHPSTLSWNLVRDLI